MAIAEPSSTTKPTDEAVAVSIPCDDGVVLGGHLWPPEGIDHHGCVIVNPATGVLARYYHHYARFLSKHGFTVLTYDYRGIGRSRPESLRGCRYRWHDWGELDFDAAVRFLHARDPAAPQMVVGHSFGGALPGLSENGARVSRMLTVGAQYGYWRDYDCRQRLALFAKWHVAMPALTALFGYFPGKRLGWLEDLPAGIAQDWAFGRGPIGHLREPAARQRIRRRFEDVTAPIVAVTTTDDPFATVAALGRTLGDYPNAPSRVVQLDPADLGFAAIGHFGLFHARHANGFWRDTLSWLRDGTDPWPEASHSRNP